MQHLINKIHHANCFEILKQLPNNSIDLVLTDPPYGITEYKYDIQALRHLDLSKWFAEIIRVAKPTAPIIIFSSGKFTYKMVNIGLKYFRYELIWDKVNKITATLDAPNRPLLNHEFILYFSKNYVRNSQPNNKQGLIPNTYNHGVIVDKENPKIRTNQFHIGGRRPRVEYKSANGKRYPRSILKFNKSSKKWLHPSEKPYPLIEYLIGLYSNSGDLVLDTFSGSGVVPHVCSNTDRAFIACELDQTYYNSSIQRLQQCLFASY